MSVTGVVLAAGASQRLGRPKQLLPLHGATLLDATLARVREAGLDQVVVALGGAAEEIRERVDLHGVEVVLNPDFGAGCATSIRAALSQVNPDAEGIVLVLGDQPGVGAGAIAALMAAAHDHAVGVCEYDDGLGHPLWFHRRMFEPLAGLHGDKSVWKLVDAGDDVVRVAIPGAVPRDVDTWADYLDILEVLG